MPFFFFSVTALFTTPIIQEQEYKVLVSYSAYMSHHIKQFQDLLIGLAYDLGKMYKLFM